MVRSRTGTSARWALVLAAIVVAAATLRAAQAADPGRFLSADERAYAALSISLADTATYEAPQMDEPLRWPPGTPVLFAVARRLAGGDDRVAAPAQFRGQAVVGTLLVVAVAWLAWSIAGPAAAVLAAAAVAFYPPFVTLTGELVSEPLGALTLTVALALLVAAWRDGSTGAFALAGAGIGIATLVRADLLLVCVVVALTVWLATRRTAGPRQAWRRGAAFAVGAAVIVGPWSVLASMRENRLVPVAASGSSTAFVATYLPGDGTMFGLRHALGDAYRAATPGHRDRADHQLRAEWILDWVAASRHPRRDREDALRAETLENLRAYALGDPLGYAAMTARKTERMWLHPYRGTHHAQRGTLTTVHLLLVGLATAGLLAGLWRSRAAPLAFVAVVLVSATALNVAFVSEARHNARLLPLLIAGGAAGAVLAVRARDRRALAPSARCDPSSGSLSP